MQFTNEKKIQLAKQDRSDKGDWDKPILALIKKINSEKDYYTTSSCSGRTVLIKGKDKKQEGLFLFRTHEKISLSKLKKEIKDASYKYKGIVYFKQESCILHVACSSLDRAQEMLDKAKLAGWKKSGIIASKRRFVAELSSTEKIELPVTNKGKSLVSEGLSKLLVKEANRKLERGWEKIKKLERML
nr:tRNA(Phe) 7-((3-amino-3-carboxypropyl)-4-demethylwyosine(37)-N(4))-methyltransferase [uncultured archaeon]